jgi:hypothetical protein
MLRSLKWSIGAGMLLAFASAEARAQYGYPGGYGGYGWGGWGATPQGSMARGLGAFAFGAGQYNLNTAQANSINADTAMRWNQANWETQHAINISSYYRRIRRRDKNNAAQAEIYDRLRNHPSSADIEDGDALNVALDELTNPKVFGTSIGTITAPLSGQIIRAIPFEHASEAVTVCLDQLTGEEGWPPALREPGFAPYRDEIHKAILVALEEDDKGTLTPPTIDKVTEAVAKLKAKFEATIPKNSPDYIPASNHIKALAGEAKMLHSPQVEEILAALDKYPGTTVGDLLMFMHAYNLRFAPAKDVRQREIYQQLFPILDGVRDRATAGSGVAGKVQEVTEGTLAAASQAAGKAKSALGSAASSFFQGMGWEHVQGKPTR